MGSMAALPDPVASAATSQLSLQTGIIPGSDGVAVPLAVRLAVRPAEDYTLRFGTGRWLQSGPPVVLNQISLETLFQAGRNLRYGVHLGWVQMRSASVFSNRDLQVMLLAGKSNGKFTWQIFSGIRLYRSWTDSSLGFERRKGQNFTGGFSLSRSLGEQGQLTLNIPVSTGGVGMSLSAGLRLPHTVELIHPGQAREAG